ncbi:cupin domain-containing protein [Ochrobactrum sp. BTU2]|uniref:cupin domain-containing protein n=1 Tax=Ochrobactrum sp. BTU2 TaxID=2856166 RepID=UPI00211A7FB8|nr:cupin domain-containing protein [Ochrobactrum sp. BTU2]MCQ9146157.1 cupin domain-containing protein [Ochrobactrum sp. BTU2]
MSSKLIVVDNRDGKSQTVSESDTPSNAFASVPGFDPAVVWGTAASASLPWDGVNSATTTRSLMPPTGGTRLWRVVFPPDSVMASPDFDPGKAGAEYAQRLPGFIEHFEPDNPGMHTTPTVDYDIVLEGEISLELDDGKLIDLEQGDIVVQHGTRHAWRNRGTKPATMIFVLIGAESKG